MRYFFELMIVMDCSSVAHHEMMDCDLFIVFSDEFYRFAYTFSIIILHLIAPSEKTERTGCLRVQVRKGTSSTVVVVRVHSKLKAGK